MNGKINAFLIAAHDDLKSELKKGDQSFFGGAQRTCNIVTRSIMRVDDQAHRVNFFSTPTLTATIHPCWR